MLMFFNRGTLPWQELGKQKTKQARYDLIHQTKMHTPIETLCKGFPDEFAALLVYARGLAFAAQPNYRYLRSLFYDMYKRMRFANNCKYDWDNVHTESKLDIVTAPSIVQSNHPIAVPTVLQDTSAPTTISQHNVMHTAMPPPADRYNADNNHVSDNKDKTDEESIIVVGDCTSATKATTLTPTLVRRNMNYDQLFDAYEVTMILKLKLYHVSCDVFIMYYVY